MIDMKNPNCSINGLAIALKTEMRRKLRAADKKGCNISVAALQIRKFYLNK